jgi:hypothetical protein
MLIVVCVSPLRALSRSRLRRMTRNAQMMLGRYCTEAEDTVDTSGNVGVGWSVGRAARSQSLCWRSQMARFTNACPGTCRCEMHEYEHVVSSVNKHGWLQSRHVNQATRRARQDKRSKACVCSGDEESGSRQALTCPIHTTSLTFSTQRASWTRQIMGDVASSTAPALFALSSAIRHLISRQIAFGVWNGVQSAVARGFLRAPGSRQ